LKCVSVTMWCGRPPEGGGWQEWTISGQGRGGLKNPRILWTSFMDGPLRNDHWNCVRLCACNVVYHMKETGWEKISQDDVGKLHYEYRAEKWLNSNATAILGTHSRICVLKSICPFPHFPPLLSSPIFELPLFPFPPSPQCLSYPYVCSPSFSWGALFYVNPATKSGGPNNPGIFSQTFICARAKIWNLCITSSYCESNFLPAPDKY